MPMVSSGGVSSHAGHDSADHNVLADIRCLLSAPATTGNNADMDAATSDDAPIAPGAASSLLDFSHDLVPAAQSDAAHPEAVDMHPQAQAAALAVLHDQPADMATAVEYPSVNVNMLDQHRDVQQPAQHEQRLSAFARLRFCDGSYYMHTYQVILGRNVELAHRDMNRLLKAQRLREAGDDKRADAIIRGKKRKRHAHTARSVVSASGGILNAPIAALPIEYQQQRRQSVASQSHSSSSHHRGPSSQEEHAPQHVLMQTFEELPDNYQNIVPEDVDDCPLVPIHPQQVTDLTGAGRPKAISRQHAKIFYNFERGGFDLEVLGANGLHHEEQFYPKGSIIPLEHGERMVIGAVEITFFLPDIALTEEQRARQDSNSRPMSFSFENGQGELESEEQMDDSGSEDASINPKHVFHMPMDHDISSEEDALGEEENDEEEEEDELLSMPVLPPKKHTLKLKLKKKPPLSTASHKDSKRGHKRKTMREVSPPELPTKKQKTKSKETHKELPKEKGKNPVKESTKEMPKEKLEPVPTPKSTSPVQVKKPSAEVRQPSEEGEIEGLITAELAENYKLPSALIGRVIAKRKGPGRPPKDGLMSKRQRSQLLKIGKEMEKAQAAGQDTGDISVLINKPKAPRARKDSNPGEGEDEDVKDSIEKGDGEDITSEKKPAKLSRPARTPSPPMRIEDYTEEQLQRPSANYVVLIHEAISSSPTGQMNLQQIYSFIEKKYPWYKFKTTTSGWQSSVRHNLGQHDAFVKGDKEGKGFNWRINPLVSIEKERRKRQITPPQMNQAQRQGFYPQANGYVPPYGPTGNTYYPGMPSHPPISNGAPQVSPNVGPRLPPSLARSAASASTPAPPAPPNASPYTSPWAGGNTAGSPPNPNPPRPYPQPSPQTPPVSSGGYGVLFPTSAPQSAYGVYTTAGTQGAHHVTAGASPYSATLPLPYTPYGQANPSTSTSQGVTTPVQPTLSQASTQNQGRFQENPVYSQRSIPGRYPANTSADIINQVETFRNTYLDKVPAQQAIIDTAIRAIFHPEQQAKLDETEKAIFDAIQKVIPGTRSGPTKAETARKGPDSTNAQRGDTNGTGSHQNIANSTGFSRAEAASAAAAIAASDAAVEAASSLPLTSLTSSSANAKPNPDPTAAASAPTASQLQTFTPNVTSPLPSTSSVLPTPIRTHTSRPSVEPLTPVPGSPAVPNGALAKKSSPETKDVGDAEPGAEEDPPKAPDSTSAPPAE